MLTFDIDIEIAVFVFAVSGLPHNMDVDLAAIAGALNVEMYKEVIVALRVFALGGAAV